MHVPRSMTTCPECGKNFAKPGNLTRHMAQVHAGRRDHRCGQCRQCFSQKGALTRHIREKHEAERKFKCHCGRKFLRKQHLEQHMKAHHADRQQVRSLKGAAAGCAPLAGSAAELVQADSPCAVQRGSHETHQFEMQVVWQGPSEEEDLGQQSRKRLRRGRERGAFTSTRARTEDLGSAQPWATGTK